MARPDTEYQITPKGEELAGRLAETRGIKNMMGNPIMSGIKSNPKRAQSQSAETPNTKEKRIKNIPNKEPNFSDVAPGNPKPLKVKDSSADILGKMYNFMIKKAEIEKKEFKQEKKFKKEQAQVKEDRTQELIGLFKVKKTRKSKEEKTKGTTPKTGKQSKKGKSKTTTAEPVAKPSTPSPTSKALPRAITPKGVAVASAGVALAGGATELIAKEEGVVTKAYWDPPDKKEKVSIGYGHQIQAEEYKQGFIQVGNEQISIKGERGIDTVMTKDQAKKLLDIDLPKYEKRAKEPLGDAWNKLNQNQKDVLTSYAYNIGSTQSLVKAGLKDAINRGDMKEAANIIREKGVRTASGKFNATLDKRRRREADIFESAAKNQIVPAETKTMDIPETVRPMTNSSNSSKPISVLNNQTNIINGGTTYASNEDRKDYGPLLEKQFYG